jgi:hypothetical protein
MGRYRWLGWAVPVVFVAFLSMREIGSADFWWQWAAGRYILENGIPWLDPWLTTSEPRPWIEMRWLYCIGLYGAVEYAGAWLAIFCAAVLYCSGLGFVLKSGAGSARWTLAIGVLAAIAIGRRLSVRPEAFTFAFLGVLLFLISRVRQGRLEPKWALIWMGLTQILWANTHALFAIGPVFCALWAFVELLQKGNYRVATAALFVTTLCSFMNPYGLTGVLYPLTLFGELHGGAYTGNIVELRSPFAMGLSPSLVAHLLLAATTLYCAFKRRGDSLLLIFAAATFYLSITAVRNVPLFALCSVAYFMSCAWETSRAARVAAAIASSAVVVFAYMFAVGTWSIEDRIGLSVNRTRYGLNAAKALVKENPGGQVFNTLVEGSLLEAQGKRAYCDPRLEVLPQKRFLEMLAIARLRKPLPDEYESVLLILDSALAADLVKRGGWRVVGMDAVAISMVREPGARVSIEELETKANAALPQHPPSFSWFRKSLSPIPYRRMATFFAHLGEHVIAERLRAEARRIYPLQ